MKNTDSAGPTNHHRGNMPQLELTFDNKSKKMNFKVQKNDLMSALSVTGRCIGKSVMPILENYRFEISGNTCMVTGSSMDIFISKEIMIKSDIHALDICVPAKKLFEHLKTLVNQELEFKVKSKELNGVEVFSMEMKYSTGKFNMPLENGNNFPNTPKVISEPIVLQNQDLISGFFKTTFAVESSTTRVTSNLMIQFGDGIKITGANPMYLSTVKVSDAEVEKKVLLLPRNAPDMLVSIGAEGDTEITYSDNNMCFKMADGTKVFAQLIDATYPEISGMLKFTADKHVEVNLAEFLGAIKRVVVFADLINRQIKLTLSSNGITLETRNEMEESCLEKISCEYTSEDLTIGINSDQIFAILSKVKSETIFMSFSDPKKPILIMEEKSELMDNVFLVIPSIIQ